MTLGVVIGSAVGPEQLAATASDAEAAGFDEIWLAEDFFFTGGIAGANIVLAATDRIGVRLGVVSALVRHPALLAMEVTTTARAHPGRFLPGVGLGVPAWMRQMGLMPRSPLTAMRECVVGLRRLLRGEEVTEAGAVFTFDRVRLVYPQTAPIPIHMGVLGPKMLQLSGEIADGSVLSVGAGVDYVEWARRQIEIGRERAGRSDPHHVTVFAIYSVDHDRDRAFAAARETLAFYKAVGGRNALTDIAGVSDDLEDMLRRGGPEAVASEMPDEWVDRLTVAGSPDEVVAKIRRLHAAGADCVALFPTPADRAAELIALTGSEVVPRL